MSIVFTLFIIFSYYFFYFVIKFKITRWIPFMNTSSKSFRPSSAAKSKPKSELPQQDGELEEYM